MACGIVVPYALFLLDYVKQYFTRGRLCVCGGTCTCVPYTCNRFCYHHIFLPLMTLFNNSLLSCSHEHKLSICFKCMLNTTPFLSSCTILPCSYETSGAPFARSTVATPQDLKRCIETDEGRCLMKVSRRICR